MLTRANLAGGVARVDDHDGAHVTPRPALEDTAGALKHFTGKMYLIILRILRPPTSQLKVPSTVSFVACLMLRLSSPMSSAQLRSSSR